ncbi:MAG: PhnD/SsuA/transferrin family substrate-binding protein [Candidatus Sumerlaeota bacterium]|nr:PhnD/SsuA/transferrin family substrate-binding protein [Candidatus Sumerlaeota bacterium]
MLMFAAGIAIHCPHAAAQESNAAPAGAKILRVAVMDPMADKLSCPCLEGYAQRRYDLLADFIGKRLGCKVQLFYGESLNVPLHESPGGIDVAIAKCSVVEYEAPTLGLKMRLIAMLTGKDGGTQLTGVFAARAKDALRSLADLKGKCILVGDPAEAEKYGAAAQALAAAGIAADQFTSAPKANCKIAAADLVKGEGAAAVISSYAYPLLAGCGAVNEGDLRIIGQTAPLPFITVFVNEALAQQRQEAILKALLDMREDAKLLKAMESKDGFVRYAGDQWTGWRGARRDGHVPRLPASLPKEPRILWERAMSSHGVGGLAATDQYVIISDKDADKKRDIWHCLDAATGKTVWEFSYAAAGALDFTNSPRATPVICDDQAYLLSAFGLLHCIRLEDKKILWKRDLPADFGAKLTQWGMASSPLVIGNKLIVNPGTPKASVVALDRKTGKDLWKTPGAAAAFASFIVAEFGGRRQAVGYDAKSLGGWDPETGERLWRLEPPQGGDFNVPTPIAVDGKLLVTSENNGTRLYGFDSAGKIIPAPLAANKDLSCDAATPVVCNGLVFGGQNCLICLDLGAQLKTCWREEGKDFDQHLSLIADGQRVLMLSLTGVLTLIEATRDGFRPLGRLQLPSGPDDAFWPHPALVGNRLFIRHSTKAYCIQL